MTGEVLVGMNQTSALVARGTSSATFPIRLPRWTGEDSLYWSCVGAPRYLVVSPTTPRMISYSLNYFYRLNNPTYPFVVRTKGGTSRRMDDLGRRLVAHMDNIAQAFPLQMSVPLLWYNTDDANDPHYEVRLPPRSGLYSSHELFFAGLGFLEGYPGVDPPQTTMTAIGGRSRRKTTARVWGFFNEAPDAIQTFRGGRVSGAYTMDVITQVTDESQYPTEMQVQAEIFEINNATDRRYVYLDQGTRAEATLSVAMTALDAMLETLKSLLHLKYQMIDVTTNGKDEIVLTNRALPGSGSAIILILDDEMADAFDYPRQRSLIFYMDTVRSYSISVPSSTLDPFKDSYPVSMISQGTGPVTSWIEGLGYANLLGVMRESGERKAIESEGTVFSVNQTDLTLQFKDSSRNDVVFKNDHQLDLMMKFTRVPNAGSKASL
jgi:hypothetical protein